MSILNLPEEIVRQILLNIEFTKIYRECSLVCSDWNEIIKNKKFLINKMCNEIVNYPSNPREVSDQELCLCRKYINNYDINFALAFSAYGSSSFKDLIFHYTFAIAENPKCFWISKETEDSFDEWLSYGLTFDAEFISELRIIFAEITNPNNREQKFCFAPFSIRIEIKNGNGDIIYIQSFSVEHTSSKQVFIFNKPIFLTLDCRVIVHFIGKREKIPGKGYYVGVKELFFYGKGGTHYPFYYDGNNFGRKSNQEFKEMVSFLILCKNKLYSCAEFCIANKSRLSPAQIEQLKDFLNQVGIFVSRVRLR